MDEFERQNFDNLSTPDPQPLRSKLLSTLCVLSFINAGYMFLSSLLSYFMQPMLNEMITNESFTALWENMAKMYNVSVDEFFQTFDAALSVNRIHYLIMAMLYIGSFIGVLKMWKLEKTGFHIYAIAQCLMLISSAIFIYQIQEGSPIWDVLLTLIFIAWYYRCSLKEMK